MIMIMRDEGINLEHFITEVLWYKLQYTSIEIINILSFSAAVLGVDEDDDEAGTSLDVPAGVVSNVL